MDTVALLVALAALVCSLIIATIQLKTRHIAMTPRLEFDTVGHQQRRGDKLVVFKNPVLTLQNLGPVDYDNVHIESIGCAHGEKQFDAVEISPGKFAGKGSIGALAVGETRRMAFEALSTSRTQLDKERPAGFAAGHGRLLVVATRGRRQWRFVTDEIPFRDYLASAIVHCRECGEFSPVSFRAAGEFVVGHAQTATQACRGCQTDVEARFTVRADSLTSGGEG